MENLKILIIEDDKRLAELLSSFLQMYSYKTEIVFSGKEALRILEESKFDLILLDLLLPEISGLQILNHQRQHDTETPIIVITSEAESESEITCYKSGTDNFHKKPINTKLLLYQIESVTNRSIKKERYLKNNDLIFDTNYKECFVANKLVSLSPKECKILEFLLRNKNRLVYKRELSLLLYSEYNGSRYKNIDTIIYRIRKKISERSPSCDFSITTYKGFGYSIP